MSDTRETNEETVTTDLWVSGTEEPGSAWHAETTDEGAQEMSWDETEARLRDQFGSVIDQVG